MLVDNHGFTIKNQVDNLRKRCHNWGCSQYLFYIKFALIANPLVKAHKCLIPSSGMPYRLWFKVSQFFNTHRPVLGNTFACSNTYQY